MKPSNHIQFGRFLRRKRGGALIIAISLLGLFVILGTEYVRYMNTELEEANYEIARTRVRALAMGGIQAAIGDLDEARRRAQERDALGEHRYRIPSYKGERTEQGLELLEETNRRHDVTVTIYDESGKVNLNHAPASVLQRVLQVDGETARAIVSSLPRTAGQEEDGGQWLLSPDDLLTRGLLSADQFARVDPGLVTTYSVVDHEHPGAYLNITTAHPRVLAAVLDIPQSAARRVSERTSFGSVAELAELAGKAPEHFNMKPQADQPGAFPEAFAQQSRCFRLLSEAKYVPLVGPQLREATALHGRMEAVVLFDAEGPGYQIVSWSVLPAVDDDDADDNPPVNGES